MDTQNTGQSEDTTGQGANPNPAGQVEENGATQTAEGATSGGEQGHEGEQDNGQGQTQSKSQNSKARLKRKFQESETRNAQLVEDNRKLAERLDSLETKLDPVINPAPPRPNRVDFDSEEDYEDALFDYRTEINKRTQNADTKQPAGAQTAQPGEQRHSPAQAVPNVPQEVEEKWTDNCDAASEKYEDFEAVAFRNDGSLPITTIMAITMKESDTGAEVAYHLGKNPAEAARIAQLTVPQQVIEIQKLAGKFTNSTTNAPDPIDPPAGGDDTIGVKDPEKMTPEEYRDWRRDQGMGR